MTAYTMSVKALINANELDGFKAVVVKRCT